MVAVNGVVGGLSAGVGGAVTTTSWQGAVALGAARGAGETVVGSLLAGQGFPSSMELLVGTGTGGLVSGGASVFGHLQTPGATAALDHSPTSTAVLVERCRSGTRPLNVRPAAADPNWGLTRRTSTSTSSGGPTALRQIDAAVNRRRVARPHPGLAGRPVTRHAEGRRSRTSSAPSRRSTVRERSSSASASPPARTARGTSSRSSRDSRWLDVHLPRLPSTPVSVAAVRDVAAADRPGAEAAVRGSPRAGRRTTVPPVRLRVRQRRQPGRPPSSSRSRRYRRGWGFAGGHEIAAEPARSRSEYVV